MKRSTPDGMSLSHIFLWGVVVGGIGFAMGLIVAVAYFLFVIIADTLRGNPKVHPELLIWIPNVLFIILGALLFRRLARQ